MKFKVWLLTLIMLAVNCFASGQAQKNQPEKATNRDKAGDKDKARDQEKVKYQAVAFLNVNLVPMDRERIVENQTVVVRDGRISEIGPAASVKVPADAQRVEGRGKYLMPGLAEMHGHMPHPNLGEKIANSFLLLFVANGITTVRTMYGFANNSIPIRDKVNRGEVLGPKLYVAAPAMSGQSIHNPEEAEKMVRQYKQEGYDLLKIHEGLSLPSYDKIVATANEVGLPYGGHIPNDVGLMHALKSRQSSVEHLDGYIEALEADNSPIRNADPVTRAQKLIYNLDEKKIPSLVSATLEAGAWNVPTMALWQTIFTDEGAASLASRPEMKYVPAGMVNQWVQQKNNQQQQGGDAEGGRRVIELRNRVLKALSDAGAKIMLGSDAPQLFSVPGFSLHREMQAMVKAGMTPYQVLEAGTRNPAIYLKAEKEFGTLEVGKRADLILVDDNPLKDLSNLAKRSGVMVRGRWMSEGELRSKLDELAASSAEAKQGS
jgi:imidazolonepropionase-like amidohydrolase